MRLFTLLKIWEVSVSPWLSARAYSLQLLHITTDHRVFRASSDVNIIEASVQESLNSFTICVTDAASGSEIYNESLKVYSEKQFYSITNNFLDWLQTNYAK